MEKQIVTQQRKPELDRVSALAREIFIVRICGPNSGKTAEHLAAQSFDDAAVFFDEHDQRKAIP